MRRITINESQLHGLIRKLAEEVYVADPPSVLGRVAFSPQRQRWGEEVPNEDNVPVEDKILKDLGTYISAAGRSLDGEMVTMLRKILNNHEYRDVIAPPRANTYVYRGIELTVQGMQELCWDAGLNINYLQAGESYRVSFDFKPRAGKLTTSWTTDENIAKEFAVKHSGIWARNEKTYNVILVALAGDSPSRFLDLDRFYRLANNVEGYRREAEVLAFGQIWVRRIIVLDIKNNDE